MTPTPATRSRRAALAVVPLLVLVMALPSPASVAVADDQQADDHTVAAARIVAPVTQELSTVGNAWPVPAPATSATVDVVDVGDGVPGSYDDVDVTGAAVLMDHTTAPSTSEKAAHAHALGATAVLVVAPSDVDMDAALELPAHASGPYGALQRFEAEISDLRLEDLVVLGLGGTDAASLRDQPGDGEVRVELHATEVADHTASAPAARGTADAQPRPGGAQSASLAGRPWEPIGPNAAAGYLGFSTDPDAMVVAPTAAPAVFLSDDRAQTWREVRMPDVIGGTPRDLVVHPDGEVIYVALWGGPGIDPTYEGHVMRSTDGGDTWGIFPGPDEEVQHLALHDSGTIIASAGNGTNLRLADDEGQTLRTVPATWGTLYDLHWIGDDLFMATTGEGLMVLRDATADDAPPPESLFSPGALGFAYRIGGDADTLVVAPMPGAQLYASIDDGETFEQIHQTTGTTFGAIDVDGDTITAAQSTASLWVSEDRGRTWEDHGRPVHGGTNLSLGRWLDPDPAESDVRYLGATGAGVYRTDTPGEFQRMGIPAAHVYELAMAQGPEGDDVLVAATFPDIFRTTVPDEPTDPISTEWESGSGEEELNVVAEHLSSSPADRSTLFKTHQSSPIGFNVIRSSDGGSSWESVGGVQGAPYGVLVHPADADAVFVSVVTGEGPELVISQNRGDTWEQVPAPFTATMAGDPTDPDRMWVGSPEGLFVSEDAGQSFTQLSDVRVHAIAVDPNQPDRLVVAGMEVFVSEDGGATLSTADTDLDHVWVSDLAFTGDNSGRVFAATESFYDAQGVLRPGHGVIASADHGRTWEPFSDELVNPNIWSLALTDDDRQLFAGAYQGSVHRVSLDPVLVDLDVMPSSADLAPGEIEQFTATAVYDDGSSVDITGEAAWTSGDAEVATVDAGLVTGQAEGSTDVTATFEGASDSATVSVTADEEEPPPGAPELVGVVVAPSHATVGRDAVVQLTAAAVYDDGSEADVTTEAAWVTGDPSIASVDDVGVVTGHAEGAIRITATFDGQSDHSTVTVDAAVEPGPDGLVRISAPPGRVEVAIAASAHRFDDGQAGAVVLARADEYPDALVGTPLAADRNAPLLLTSSDTLLANVADEIDRVLGGTGTVYLLGGAAALDPSVEEAITDLGYDTARLGGQTRFETSGVIADALEDRSQLLITTGLDFPDALTAGAAAAAFDGVVLLSAGDLPTPVVDAYLDGFIGDVTAIGGPATRAYPDAQPVFGQTRDGTAVAVADAFFPDAITFGVARADDYPDALAGGAHLAAYEGPLLLSHTDALPPDTARWVGDAVLTRGFVYGGTAAISEQVHAQLTDLAF